MEPRKEFWGLPSSSTWGVRQFFRGFVLYGNVNEGQGGPAQSLVFAKDQRQIATDLHVSDGDCHQSLGTNVILDVGACDESDTDIGRDKPF